MQSLRRTLLNPRPLTTLRAFSTTRPSSIARMSLIGRLAATPELTSTSTSRDLIRYAIGSSSGPADNRHTSWFRIGAFVGEGNLRDFMLRQEKGTLVSVEADGEMRNLETEAGSRQILNLKQRDFQVLSKPLNRANAEEERHASMGEEGDGALAGSG